MYLRSIWLEYIINLRISSLFYIDYVSEKDMNRIYNQFKLIKSKLSKTFI
jgi:hypothetical protein